MPKPSIASPFLSAPAAKPIRLEKFIPITVLDKPFGVSMSDLKSG